MPHHVVLFGSSLNPMTQAHLVIIRKLSETFPESEIRIVPVYKHPDPKALAPFADRVQMAVQVVEAEKQKGTLQNVVVSDIEATVYNAIYHEICWESMCSTLGKSFVPNVNYATEVQNELIKLQETDEPLFKKCQDNIAKLGVRTYRLLDYLKNNEKDTEFAFAFGGDTLAALLAGNWSKGDVIIRQCAQLIYVNRPGSEIKEIKSTSAKPEVQAAIDSAIKDGHDKFQALAVFSANQESLQNVSSTGFREFRDIDPDLIKTVPWGVLEYCYQNKLYGFGDDFCTDATIIAWYKAKHKISGELVFDAIQAINEEAQRRTAKQALAIAYTKTLIRDKNSAVSLVNLSNSFLNNATDEESPNSDRANSLNI
ncbi:MAG: hypothetical protein WC627_10785 [Legionella sp.]|jgi:nicotinic acid mononucleotide adenylyltransferase